MAPNSDTSPRKKRSGTSMVVWMLMAMLVLGLGGFGVTNFGGGVTAIGAIGDRDIEANDYVRALQQEIRAFSAQVGQPVPFAQAQALGLDQRALSGVISRATLDAEAARIGISAGDAVVASEITGMQAFQGTTGNFDRETYRLSLQQNNLTESGFEADLRNDVARSLLQGAVVGGFAAPAAFTDTLFAWAGEQRGFSLLRLTEADLPTPLVPATDAEITAFYNTNIARFTRPEAKRITYAALLPEVLAKDMPVDEVALKELYQSRISEFVLPEKRLVERLVFGTEAEAQAAKARIDAGETFDALVAERKLTLDDVDIGDVSKDELGGAGDAVFALTGPGIVGPLPSDLGPALFRMNAVLAAQETSFDEARPALASEMQTDAARRAIADKVEMIDDLLAGGATLEDLAREQGMELQTIDYAEAADDNAPIAGYPDFRTAAAALAAGDFPEAVLLDDGGLAALRLESLVPPQPIPLAGIRDTVIEAQRGETLAKALSDRAIEIKSAVESGAPLADFGTPEVTPAIDRQGFIENTPEEMIAAIFTMQQGELRVIEAPGFTGIVQLTSIAPAATTGDDATALREAITVQTQQSISQDAFTAFTNGLTSAAGITLNQAAINAINTQIN